MSISQTTNTKNDSKLLSLNLKQYLLLVLTNSISYIRNRRQVRLASPVPFKAKKSLLPAQSECCKGRKTLVLDLDETLVHSSFQCGQYEDFVLPVSNL